MNILVHAFYVNPKKGSEFSVSWNYIVQMSKYHHLIVIVGSCDFEIGHFSELQNINIQNVEFIFVKPNKIVFFLDYLYRRCLYKLGGWSKYIAINARDRQIYKYLKKEKDILSEVDLIHFINPVGFHEIGYLYRLNKPYIWGPMGGFTNCKSVFYKHYLNGGKSILLKNIYNTFSIKTSLHLREALKKSTIVIADTGDNYEYLKNHFKIKNLLYFPENSMRNSIVSLKSDDFIKSKYSRIEKIEFIWCGSLVPRKMPNLLLDSITRLKSISKIHFSIVGGGYLFDILNSMIKERNIGECVTVTNGLPRDDVQKIFEKAHVHILTSSYEANTTVMFEAMENCVPSIAFDHFGMSDLIENNVDGLKLPVEDYDKMCLSLASAIESIIENPDVLLSYSLALKEKSKKYTSEKRIDFFNKCFKMAFTE